MMLNIRIPWPCCVIAFIVLAVLPGCELKPAADKGPAAGGALPGGPQIPATNEDEAGPAADSPAFESPQEAVTQWVEAYQQDGEEGHRRLTFDQNDLPDETWQMTLESYDEVAKAGEVEVLEVLKRDQLTAVIVRFGRHINRICLYQDAAGWHICRTLTNWDAIKMPTVYGGLVKTAFNLSADAGVREIEWRKKLQLEDYAPKAPGST